MRLGLRGRPCRLVPGLEQSPRLREQQRTGRRQGDPARVAPQQRHTQGSLELAELLAQRRLRDVQPLGGAREAQLLGDGYEVAKIAQVHVHSQQLYQHVLAVAGGPRGSSLSGTTSHRQQENQVVDLTIHTYTAAESGLFVNSYLLETPAGAGAVDTNLLVSDIAALKSRLAALHKPLLGAFITHAHPDHFNGALELVRDREVPVYATSAVARAIREVADAKRAQWSPVYGAEWPTGTYYPNTELS